jgi:hypothetical protein
VVDQPEESHEERDLKCRSPIRAAERVHLFKTPFVRRRWMLQSLRELQ